MFTCLLDAFSGVAAYGVPYLLLILVSSFIVTKTRLGFWLSFCAYLLLLPFVGMLMALSGRRRKKR
jgi:hypothetical protein